MELTEACEYLLYLENEKNEKLLFQRWITQPQFSMSFDDFKAALLPQKQKSDDEIMEDVNSIIELMGGGQHRSI